MDTLATFDALNAAIEALTLQAMETDTASPEGSAVRAAITTLEMIRDQRGCEHLDACHDGRLTTFIDTIVFG